MYTHDKNVAIVLSLLKAHRISQIVISPGVTNVPVAQSVQDDPYFKCYSVVDERGAGYFATGLAFETGEPVVISCTGATASRNYLPALTEAYYRRLPIIALTSQAGTSDFDELRPQFIDRSVSQNDVKRYYAHLPNVTKKEDEMIVAYKVNKGLQIAKRLSAPIHFNLSADYALYKFTQKTLPCVPIIDFFNAEDLCEICTTNNLAQELYHKKIAVFIGSHRKFTEEETNAIEKFCRVFNVAVIACHESNYHGANKIHSGQLCQSRGEIIDADIVIDMGGIVADYSFRYSSHCRVWRVSEDGEWHQRFGAKGNLVKQFDCSEKFFFEKMSKAYGKITADESALKYDNTPIKSNTEYYKLLRGKIANIVTPDLPFSNVYIASKLAKAIPVHSSLHLGILNSYRSVNFFNLDESIDIVTNCGGFGIDGALSTAAGQACANYEHLVFAVVGDLAFFYDMNALGIRHIRNNLRIILINNGLGVEFRLNKGLEVVQHEKLDLFTAAKGHFGSAKAWAESMGFKYFTASTKGDLEKVLPEFTNASVSHCGSPMLLECFTTVEDEQAARDMQINANTAQKKGMAETTKLLSKKVLPAGVIKAIKQLHIRLK